MSLAYTLRTKITQWFLVFFLLYFTKNIVKFKILFFIFKIFPTLPFSQNSILIFHNIIRIQRVINLCPSLHYMYSIHVCIFSSPIWVHAVALCTLTSMSCHVYPTVLLLVKIKSFFLPQFSQQDLPSLEKMKLSAISLYIITNNKHARIRTCILLSDHCWWQGKKKDSLIFIS